MKPHERQRQADRLHHEGRIAWLTADAPRWACGTPVAKHDADAMIKASRQALHQINDLGIYINSAPPQD